MIEISNRIKYLKKKESQERTVSAASKLNLQERAANMQRLYRYERMWSALSDFRTRRRRNKEYFNGNQWNDGIEIVDKQGRKKVISEAENIRMQGKIPLKNNVISSTVTSILGVFRQSYGKPEIIARIEDNHKIGEMNTCMAEYIHQITRAKELDAKDMLEACISGCALQMVDYQWNNVTGKNEEVFVSHNPSRMFLNGGIEDPRGNDIHTIGVLMDMTKGQLKKCFARSTEDSELLDEIYKRCNKNDLETAYRTFSRSTAFNLDFYKPQNADLCRVIQAWELESETIYVVHDHLYGTFDQYPLSDGKAIDQMIKEREKFIEDNGLDYESCKLEKTYYDDEYWYVRYLSPFGDILYENRSPFNHKSHPFVIYMGHLIDGEIHSFVENIIDQQRYINRLVTLIDFIIGSSAKGVLVFPENALPKGMRKEDILDQWTSYRGVIFANLKPGMQMPQQISTNATNVGANELLQLQLQLIRDISGVHGALQGKEAKSGTAASLYNMQATNAQVNIADLLESFTEFRRNRDYKAIKIAPQCYDTPFYINLAGNEYSAEAKAWRPEIAKSADVYVNLDENNNTSVYRMMASSIVMKAMEMRLIDFETVLETNLIPNGEKLLSIIERRKERLQQEQMQQQAAMMQGQAQGQAMQEAGASQAEVQQAAADAAIQEAFGGDNGEANPQAMELIRQALGQN